MLVPAAGLAAPSSWASTGHIGSARLWPAQEYTRLILESPAPIEHQLVVLRDPNRVVLDLARVDPTPELRDLPARVQPGDPYIASIRIGVQSGGFLRVVLILKDEVNPQVFALKPVAEFGYRLVVDLYPLIPFDPLMALLESEQRREALRPTVPESRPMPESRPVPESRPPLPESRPMPESRPVPESRPPLPESRPPIARAPEPTPRSAIRRITIAIDPGHGGEDPGAIGKRGTYEKNVVLAIARKLKVILDAEPNMRAMLTRDDDYFVPLATRVQKARRVQADLFISIHADAFRESQARGSSVFALSEHGATSAAARWLAQKENAADLIGGVNLGAKDPLLARTLLDLSQTAQINDSLKVGRQVLDVIGTHNALHRGTVEQAGFAVLKAPDIPSILIETAFISNPDEEQKLRSERHQQKFADSIAAGVKRYFARNPPLARA
ncbi:MAG TPA: N-acetylmuramoyl-L-alanine amidase [Casimicrobiaceae bacterium]